MEAPIQHVKRVAKVDKKRDKKLHRIISRARNRFELDVSSTPTNIVFVGNAGLTTGTQPEDIVSSMLLYGPVVDCTMIPGESFCFVEFSSVDDATSAVNGMSGNSANQIDRPLYLTFVSKVPECTSSTRYTDDELPEGLRILEDAVTADEAEMLLNNLSWASTVTSEENVLRHRKVKHYGYRFCYDTNGVDIDNPLPDPFPAICTKLLHRLHDGGIINHIADQITVNEYQPGQGIPPHIDTHSPFEDEILSLSLGAQIVMEFKCPDGRHRQILLPERSLMIMTGESRYLWSHGITPRKMDIIQSKTKGLKLLHRGVRTSFTFRKLRTEPCRCVFKDQCDSQRETSNFLSGVTETQTFGQTAELAQTLEDCHVHKVYDEIATHFSSTRHKPWPKIDAFLHSLPMGSLLLDVGCGNGKYLHDDNTLYKVGCDRSLNLVNICRDRGFQAFCCDALELPVKSNFFDACICIAVIHHLSSSERRVQAIEELGRILRPGGLALIYVWAMEQKLDKKGSNYLKASKSKPPTVLSNTESLSDSLESDQNEAPLCNLPIHVNRTEFEHQDLLVPWHLKLKECSNGENNSTSKSNIFHRYYHVFSKGELEDLCVKVPDFKINDCYHDEGNWCVVLEKIK